MTPTLRAMTAEDIAGGLRLSRASGWNQLEEDWRAIIDSPGGGWLATQDGNVIGTAALMRYDNLAWVAMMLVDPAERRTGLGSRLLAAALDAANGAPSVGLDATPAGEPLYRRFDFVESYSLVRIRSTIDQVRFDAHSGDARPMVAADLAAVSGVDRDVFGADRSELLASLLARAPGCAWIVDGRGYCFGRPGNRYSQLGPVVSTESATARDLVSHCLAHLDGPFAMDVPLLDAEWLAWLKSAGFEEERRFVRMFLRGHTHPGIPSRQYAICGPEFA